MSKSPGGPPRWLSSPLSFVVCASACGGKASTPPAAHRVEVPAAGAASPTKVAPSPPGERLTLAWSRAGDGVVRTRWLRAMGPEYEIVREDVGPHLYARGATWRFELERASVPLFGCDVIMNDTRPRGPPSSQGEVFRALVATQHGRQHEVLPAPTFADSELVFSDYTQSLELIASVGPYLFLVEHSYGYACGAHGSSSARFVVYDLESGGAASVLPDLREVAAEHQLAFAALEDDSLGDQKLEEVELVMMVPRVEADGALHVDYVFAIPTCYACTRGEWSSYYASTRVPARALPESLRRWTPTPELSAYARGGAAPIHGYSQSPGSR